jgi:FKBP-type peptidyl-prolyl cis-trans isomerase SlyD
MEITNNRVVTLNFTLTDDEGTILDQSQDDTFTFVQGRGQILPALEMALAGKAPGDHVEVTLPPEAGFGEIVPDFTEVAPRKLFKDIKLKPGMTFQLRGKDGKMLPIRIVRIDGDDVHIDANHPLAGLTLYFALDVVDVRDSTT